MLFGKLFTNPKMWMNGDANEIKMNGVYTCKDVQNVPTGDGALFVFKTENTVKQVFVPVGEEGVVYTRVIGEEWASVTGTSEETEALIQSAIDKANQAQAKADTVDTRLNNIILESGTSDAEVVAARTDSNGQTFTTLGVRLDTQFGEIKEDLSAVSLLESMVISPNYVQGKNISSVGKIVDNTKRIACIDFIDISDARKSSNLILQDNALAEGVYYQIADGYRIYVAYYTSPDLSAFVSTEGWLTGSGHLTPTGDYMRLGCATVGDSTTMTVANAGNIVLSSNYSLKSVIERCYKWGLFYKGSIGNTTDANDVTDVGIYLFNSAKMPTNMPKTASGTFIVLPMLKLESATPSHVTDLMQVALYSDGDIWIRYARFASSAYTWRDWTIVNPVRIIGDKTKWLALGDSITGGVYSTGSDATSTTTNSWVRLIAGALHYDVTVFASRGLGYTVTGQDPDDSTQPRISMDTFLNRVESMTENDYNLVTFAFGINDYNTSSSTIADITTSVNNALSRLGAKFPNARIVVITPFNTCRHGDTSTNWGYGATNGTKTLKDVSDAIVDRCKAYGFEYIDASNGVVFNAYNIQAQEPDAVHPSLTGHMLLAKTLAQYLIR